jgi:hypothetical protein
VVVHIFMCFRQFMFDFTNLLPRQKILIVLTVIAWVLLLVCSAFNLMGQDTLNQMIFFYSLGVPMFLLMFDTIIDLNDKNVFAIWMTIAIVNFLFSLTTYNNDKFIIRRTAKFDQTSGVNIWIGNHSTSSLKALLIFLIVYRLLNKLMNKKGLFLINTFRKRRWYHEVAQRRITGLDVLTNVILYAVIIASVLFGH